MNVLKDSQWIRQSMLLPKRSIDATDMLRRTYSNDFRKFSDTTLGGNQACNPPPQFTSYADIAGRRFNQDISFGMGRYYSEVIDDNSVYVNMRFGVPVFNSLTSFFGNFYSSDASRLARQGRTNGVGEWLGDLGYGIGNLAGFVLSIGFLPYILAGQTLKFLAGKTSTRYYYLKPNMYSYWSAVQMIANQYSVNAGFVAGMSPEEYGENVRGLTPQDISERNRLLPDIWRSNGSVDIYATSTRHQRLANKQYAELQRIREEATSLDDLKGRWKSFLEKPLIENEYRPMNEYLKSYLQLEQTKPTIATEKTQTVAGENGETATAGAFLSEQAETITDYFGKNGKEDAGFSDYMLAELRDGAQFVTFRVDNPGTVGESFSSTVRDSDIAGTVNSMSSGARNMRFSVANGNVSDGIIGSTIGAATEFIGGIIGGVADAMSISGLASLAGNAFVDIPKHWDGSTANLPRMQYTMELRAPYGNEVSRFQNLIVPLAMLLAGALPLSTGTQSYTSPFLCELYCRGRAQTRLGIIDSLEVTRGAGNVGWTQDGKPLGIDISFSVVDLSSVIHMPLTNGFAGVSGGPLEIFKPGGISRMLGADDTSFADYMAVLSGMGLTDQIYQVRKLKRNFYRTVLDFQSWASPANAAAWIGNWSSVRIISGFANGTNRN